MGDEVGLPIVVDGEVVELVIVSKDTAAVLLVISSVGLPEVGSEIGVADDGSMRRSGKAVGVAVSSNEKGKVVGSFTADFVGPLVATTGYLVGA